MPAEAKRRSAPVSARRRIADVPEPPIPTAPVAPGWEPYQPSIKLAGICQCRAQGAFCKGTSIRCARCVPRVAA